MRELLRNHLESVTGVTNWNSINFGILPNEDPKGWLFLSSTEVRNRTRSTQVWVFAIAVSAYTLDSLSDKILELTGFIVEAFKNPTQCVEGLGSMELLGSVEIESPQSYPNQGNQTNTSGFFTAITFSLEIN